jgi:sulfoxide reductase heme-binding subunit YedZ
MSQIDLQGLCRDFIGVLRKQKKTLDPQAYGITSPCITRVIVWLTDPWNACLTLCVAPFIELLLLMATGGLGPNAIEGFHLFTGIWSLRFLLVTLFVTPIQTITRWRGMAAFRQLFGLSSFSYAALHVYGYLWIDQGLIWSSITTDILETRYIWFGLFAFIVLLLLALTSPTAAMKIMGRRWKKLHRWIYPASVAVIFHYAMQLKGNLVDPLFYGLGIAFLLLFRLGVWLKNRQLARLMIPKAKVINESDEVETRPGIR